MSIISDSLKRIKPSPTIVVTQKARELRAAGNVSVAPMVPNNDTIINKLAIKDRLASKPNTP